MARGGRRQGAGRPAEPIAVHLLKGTHRVSRHGPIPAAAAPLPVAEAEAAPEWHPSPAQRAELGGLARLWLDAVVLVYAFSSSRRARTSPRAENVTRVEALERNGSSPALSRELRSFGQQWGALGLK